MSISKEDVELIAAGIRKLAADLDSDARARQSVAAGGVSEQLPRSTEEESKLLQDLHARYLARQSFRPGDLVRWKRGMQNRRFPIADQVGIVVEVLAQPMLSPIVDPGSAYFREVLDLRVGISNERGEFNTYYFDSSRFEKID